MSLSSIKSVVEQNATVVEWRGVQVRVCKLRADDGMDLYEQSAELATDIEGKPADRKEVRQFFENLLKRTVIEDDGAFSFQTPEGEALLARMSFVELDELGKLILEWSGLSGESKKN
jgi:hypothetical protein